VVRDGSSSPSAVHGDTHRQATDRIHPDVRVVDGRLRGGRLESYARRIQPGDAFGRYARDLGGRGAGEQVPRELVGQQVGGARKTYARLEADDGLVPFVVPDQRASRVVHEVGLTGGLQRVHPPPVGRCPPHPHPRAVDEQIGQLGERLGDRQVQVTLGLHVPGETEVGRILRQCQQGGRVGGRVVDRQQARDMRGGDQQRTRQAGRCPSRERRHRSSVRVSWTGARP
jgi:hypothetical protein